MISPDGGHVLNRSLRPVNYLNNRKSACLALVFFGIQGAVLVWICRIEALLDDRKIFLCRKNPAPSITVAFIADF